MIFIVVLGINRNILECKDRIIRKCSDGNMVLIETYWNVKKVTARVVETGLKVLIETYWNVKLSLNIVSKECFEY